MASLSKIIGELGTTWRIAFFLGDDTKRRYLHIGKMSQAQAIGVKTKVEHLIAAKTTGIAPDLSVSRWVAERDDELHKKLSHHGLVAERIKVKVPMLSKFIDDYVARRTDVKRGTLIWYRQTRRNLVDFFGAAKRLQDISVGEANDFRRWLTCPNNTDNPKDSGEGLGENTARKRCAIAKQMFADALDREIISRNPFGKMEGLSVGASKGRDYFVGRDDAAKVLGACPDAQWRLLFALSRYGGLRCPSEHMALRWSNIDWERGRIVVPSSKTAHHEGKDERVIPLFPELRPYLQDVLDELLVDFDPKRVRLSEQPVITRYRGSNANLRTQLCRIIRKAGMTPWPKLFQNLRSTRATELAAEHPAHVAAAWMGHSTVVANKHYWRVTDADYESAIQSPHHLAHQNTAQCVGTDRQAPEQECEKPDDYENRRVPVVFPVLPVGLEPTTY